MKRNASRANKLYRKADNGAANVNEKRVNERQKQSRWSSLGIWLDSSETKRKAILYHRDCADANPAQIKDHRPSFRLMEGQLTVAIRARNLLFRTQPRHTRPREREAATRCTRCMPNNYLAGPTGVGHEKRGRKAKIPLAKFSLIAFPLPHPSFFSRTLPRLVHGRQTIKALHRWFGQSGKGE